MYHKIFKRYLSDDLICFKWKLLCKLNIRNGFIAVNDGDYYIYFCENCEEDFDLRYERGIVINDFKEDIMKYCPNCGKKIKYKKVKR